MIVGLALSTVLLGGVAQGVEPSSPDPEGLTRPNIVFIYADDHAEAAVGAYGSKINSTPHIDSLAAEGVRFTSSFVGNSICGPARACVLTGTHSHVNGKTTNQAGFRDELPSFVKALQASGYQTATVGKWHLPTTPTGFDFWVKSHGYYVNGVETSAGKLDVRGYTTDVLTDLTIDWIERRDPDKPFFAWLSHNATHRTWMPATRHLTMYDDVTIPEPATLFDDYRGRSQGMADTRMRVAEDLFPAYDLKLPVTGEGILDGNAKGRMRGMTAEQRRAWDAAYGPKNAAFAAAELEGEELTRWKYQRYIKDYLRCVAAVDESVGRILDYLERSGLEDDTIVIYSSDQGFFLGEHGWYDKRWMYEPALRTPLIVRWPGVSTPNSTVPQLVQNIDMAPSFMEMAGLKPASSMQGKSLVPLLKDEAPERWRDAIYYHFRETGGGRTSHNAARHYGIRTERYKLIHVYDHDAWELFDLAEDPDELNNLYADPARAGLVKGLKQRLRELQDEYDELEVQPRD